MPLFSNTAPNKKAEDEDISYADEEEQKSLLASTQAEFQQYKLENEMKLKKLEEALGKLEDKNETDEEDISVEVKLEEDTFSLMMLNPICSWAYVLGIVTFFAQFALVILLLVANFEREFEQLQDGGVNEDKRTYLSIPIGVPQSVRVGQYFVAILSIWLQADVQIAIQYLFLLRSGTTNMETLKRHQVANMGQQGSGTNQKKANFLFMIRAVYIPNFLRLVQGLLVLIMLTLLIVQNNDYIELLMNFTALYVISEVDDIMYKLVRRGFFFCFHVTKSAADMENIVLRDNKRKGACSSICSSYMFRSIILVVLSISMIACVFTVAQLQNNGFFLGKVYPNCTVSIPSYISDGICDNNDMYNTKDCGYDGGDCDAINEQFGDDFTGEGCVVETPAWLGDGIVSTMSLFLLYYLQGLYLIDICLTV